jgi:hypothetical protein
MAWMVGDATTPTMSSQQIYTAGSLTVRRVGRLLGFWQTLLLVVINSLLLDAVKGALFKVYSASSLRWYAHLDVKVHLNLDTNQHRSLE